jgi:transcriptional regulator with XRE-family HTH domain
MKFGEYLRNRRTELGWTQPDASAKASIEQSYLSKLETGKSFPSEDVYGRLVEAFSLDTEAMVAAVYPAELDRLRDVGAVRNLLLAREHDTRSATRHWLYAGLAALVLGGALIGLAQVDRGGATTRYTYQSYGVVGPGETDEIFSEDLEPADEQTIYIPDMRGPAYTEAVRGAARVASRGCQCGERAGAFWMGARSGLRADNRRARMLLYKLAQTLRTS